MKRSFFTVALAVATLAATTAHADSRLDRIKASGEIALGYRDSSLPFSYIDDNQKPIGYSMDICAKIADAVKANLGLPALKVKLVALTSSTRIPLVANGTVDLSCGSATNNMERQEMVSFAPTTFVTANRFVAKKSTNAKALEDLKGKTVVSTAGTSNIKWLSEVNGEKKLDMKIIAAKDHGDGFLMVESGRAAAFFMDDILLAGLVAGSRKPDDWDISKDAFSVEPYAIIQPKDDPAFKKVVDDAVMAMMKDGSLETTYKKWFLSPMPPKNINLNWPISDQLRRVIDKPTDSGDPAAYK